MKQFKTSFRALYKFRLYTIVNILGLAVSLACVIIIARYVHQETTVNRFVNDLERTYILSVNEHENNRKKFGGLLSHNKEDMNIPDLLTHPAIEEMTTFFVFDEDNVSVNDNRVNVKSIAADNSFFNLLPYPLLYGSKKLNSAQDVIITHELAQKLFGKEQPVGQTIHYLQGEELKVVGVLKAPTTKTSFDFDIILNRDKRQFMAMMPYTLVKLQSKADVDQINAVNQAPITHRGISPVAVQLSLYPLKKVYFDTTHEITGLSRDKKQTFFIQGSKSNIKMLSAVALLVFIVGLFNFINIYTVITLNRSKEFGVKKILGVSKLQFFTQIYLENLLMTTIALLSAWFFIEITHSFQHKIINTDVLPLTAFNWLFSLAILVIVPLIASAYPYLKYVTSLPVHSVQSIRVRNKSYNSRVVFLAMQYFISFGLFIIMLFFIKQLNFMLKSEQGYNTENIVFTKMMHREMSIADPMEYFEKVDKDVAFLKEQMNSSALFQHWDYGKPIHDLTAKVKVKRTDQPIYHDVHILNLSPQLLHIFDFSWVEGRQWDSTDHNGNRKYIINEAAQKLFEIENIYETTLETQFEARDGQQAPPYHIVGVIKDFQTGHLSKSTVPLLITYTDAGFHFDYMYAQFVEGRKDEAVAYIESIYKEVNDNADFTYTLLDEEIAQLYDEDKRVSNVYTLFALLAIVISAMGLFALSLFDIQQRYREIALRKINGATAKDIMQLLLKKYLYLLSGAFVVAVPVSYFAISRYLEGFAHKAPISWWLFAVAAVVVSAISLLTLVWQIKRAMKINPANALQSE